ncbi:MAG: Na+/H+ antiporter NhaC family protein [Halanaerobium sp.]|nr:Na+/H+ antiporter NhaC family protein [Halanaerobium sp.]
MENFGWVSLLPPVIALILAWWSREVLVSLFVGILLGATILAGYNPLTGFLRTLDTYVVQSLADSWNAAVLLFLLSLGGMVGIISRMGASRALADYVAERANSTTRAQLATWLLGILVFFDDYANSLIVGNTMRSITDRLQISREKLSYIVDSTAAPITSMALISTWVGYEMGLIQKAFDQLGMEGNIYSVFLQTIPFRFYSIFAILMVLWLIISRRDFGPMLRAERRARTEGKVNADGARPLVSEDLDRMAGEMDSDEVNLRWYHAFIPVLGVIIITLAGLWFNGGGLDGAGVREAFGNADSSVVLLWASFGGSLIAMLIALGRRLLNLQQVVEAWVEGAKSLAVASIILILAWSLGSVIEELGTANFLVSLTRGVLPPYLVPALMFIVPGIVAFATGTSWGTNAIIMPLAIPLAVNLGAPLIPTIGAVLTGCVFGDHCSPISDTTIMSSTASGADHLDHVKTQLPYALAVALVALLFGFLPAGWGISPLFTLPLGAVALYIIVRACGQPVEEEVLAAEVEAISETT